jgi:hypothetical protein
MAQVKPANSSEQKILINMMWANQSSTSDTNGVTWTQGKLTRIKTAAKHIRQFSQRLLSMQLSLQFSPKEMYLNFRYKQANPNRIQNTTPGFITNMKSDIKKQDRSATMSQRGLANKQNLRIWPR